MKKLMLTLFVLTVLVSVTSCKKVVFDEAKKTLVVGMECAYQPFNWLETKPSDTNVAINGKPNMYAEGYDIQMAKCITAELGYRLVIEMIPWDGLINALNSGNIDAVIAGMSPTEKRKQAISFTDEYYRSNHVILLKQSSHFSKAKTFADLSGAKVMGQRGTLYEQLAQQISEKNKNAIYVTPLATVPEIINALNTGIIDLTVLEEPVAKGIVAEYPDFTYLRLDSPFDVSEEDLVVAIGVRKHDTALLANLNKALATISKEQREILMNTAVNGKVK